MYILGEEIDKLMTSRNMKDTNEAECNLIAEEVNVNLHKLGVLMMNQIGRQVNCRDVVAVHDSCLGQRALKINKQLTKPSGLGNSISDSPVFILGTGARSSSLAFGGPRHKGRDQEDTITKSGATIIRAASPVSIGISRQ